MHIAKILLISIHAPAKGATTTFLLYYCIIDNFNPRSREGSDLLYPSSHRVRIYFNPRSREGSDRYLIFSNFVQVDFNPRSREGSDNAAATGGKILLNFNPRSREGSDPDQTSYSPDPKISIHAPAKGATDNGFCGQILPDISIHAPAKGATYKHLRT